MLGDLQKHQRADSVAEHRRVDRDGEAGDRADPAESLDPGVRRRAGDVTACGEVGEGQSAVIDQRPEDGSIDAVDLSTRSRRWRDLRHFVADRRSLVTIVRSFLKW